VLGHCWWLVASSLVGSSGRVSCTTKRLVQANREAGPFGDPLYLWNIAGEPEQHLHNLSRRLLEPLFFDSLHLKERL
jgi:hypothetical protein